MDRALDPRLEDPVAGGVEVKQRGRGAVGPDTPLDGARQLPDLRASRAGRVPPNASALPENVPAGLRDASRYSPGGQNLARQPTLAKRVSQRALVSCPRKLWTKRRAGRGGPCAEHAESQPAPGNRKEPRECGFRLRQRAEATVPRRGPPAPPGARESTDFWDTTLVRTARYFRRRRRTTTMIPQTSTAPGSTASGSQSTMLAWAEVRMIGFCRVSLGRIEIMSSCSASQETTLRKKSRLATWASPRSWLEAKSAVPTTTMRALAGLFSSPLSGLRSPFASGWDSMVATRATGRGPAFSPGSFFASPLWKTDLSVSPQDWRLVLARGWRLIPLGGAFAASTERVRGNRVMTPARSLVIGCESYWLMMGTRGPTPKICARGFSSMTTSSSRVTPYFCRYFASPSA